MIGSHPEELGRLAGDRGRRGGSGRKGVGEGEKHVWQSRVEIEGYSIAYFDHIDAFEAPHH